MWMSMYWWLLLYIMHYVRTETQEDWQREGRNTNERNVVFLFKYIFFQ